jgi:hypothetical protein
MTDDNFVVTTLLAFCWKLFGCNTLVTHIIFTFIGIALIYQIYNLCRLYIKNKSLLPFIFLFVVSDTALVTQILIIQVDPIMLLFGFMSINYMLRKKILLFSLSLFFLAMVRARGFDLCIGIGLAYYLILLKDKHWQQPLLTLKQAIKPFIPAICCYAALYIFHSFIYDSWALSRKDPTWEYALDFVDLKQFLKNIAALIRFSGEYGRMFVWIALLFAVIKLGKTAFISKEISNLWIILLSTFSAIIPITLFVCNTFSTAYFITYYILFALIAGILLSKAFYKKAKWILIVLTMFLWSGHLWSQYYPEKLAQAWCCTLAHVPYYELRKDVYAYLDENNIDFATTSFGFPSAKGKYTELNNDEREFASLDFQTNKYIVYSNISNFDDETLDNVKKWHLIKEWKKGAVFIQLYEHP